MPKHNTYEQDENISENDIILGSDAEDNLKTKNFRIGKLKDYFLSFVETIVGPQGPQGPPGESASVNYKVYTALLTQSGTNAPVATVLENTLGDINFGYNGPGSYFILSDNLFTENLTFVQINPSNDGDYVGAPHLINKSVIDTSTIGFTVNVPLTGVSENNFLFNNELEIRVYN